MRVLEHQRARGGQRLTWCGCVCKALGRERLIVHEPQVCTFCEVVPQPKADGKPVGGGIVLNEGVAGRARIQRSAHTQPGQMNVSGLVARTEAEPRHLVVAAKLELWRNIPC